VISTRRGPGEQETVPGAPSAGQMVHTVEMDGLLGPAFLAKRYKGRGRGTRSWDAIVGCSRGNTVPRLWLSSTGRKHSITQGEGTCYLAWMPCSTQSLIS
jgi:hypothetical protein